MRTLYATKKLGQGRPSLIFTLKFQDLALIEVTRLADFSSSNLVIENEPFEVFRDFVNL